MVLTGIDWDMILKKLKPDEKKVYKLVDDFLKKLNAKIKKTNLLAVAITGGSIAKGTFLKDDHDVDIFVTFDKSYKTEELSNLLESCLKGFSYERVHGSRDYFQIKEKKLIFELVPVYKITQAHEAVNITDASPLHAIWVKEQIAKKEKLADSIRLAKAFCKAQELYGAESYIRGFSGHVLDILTIHYGGFASLMKGAATWEGKKIIDINNYHKGNVLKNVNKAKLESSLILIDPIDPYRNASASLSDEKFYLFSQRAKEFLENPSSSFFVKKVLTLAGLKKMATELGKDFVLLFFEALSQEGKEDVEGAKLLKVFEYMRNQYILNGFFVKESGWKFDKKKKAFFWFIVSPKELPKTYDWEGPKIADTENVALFMKKHAKTYEKGERIFASVDRKYTKPKELLSHILKEDFVKEKVKKILLK